MTRLTELRLNGNRITKILSTNFNGVQHLEILYVVVLSLALVLF